MMKLLQIACCVFASLQTSGSPARDAWLSERRDLVNEAVESPELEKIPRLSRTIRGIGRRLENATPESIEIYQGAVKAMLSIPGYAEYYRDRVLAAREQLDAVRAGKNTDLLEGTAVHLLREAQADCFGTLGFLPSVETVRVLGEFLSDDQGWRILTPDSTRMDNEWASLEIPNCRYAANALERLPIVGSPFQRGRWQRNYTREEVAVWKQWYQEIKDGKRTFRFEADPTEYDLNGPAPAQKLAQIARDKRRDTERAERYGGTPIAGAQAQAGSSESRQPSAGVPVSLLAAGALVVVALGWYFLRGRESGKLS